MPRLTSAQRERGIGMLDMGATQHHVATTMGCSKSTIARLVTRIRQTGSTADRPRSNRPRVTSQREDRYVRVLHVSTRFLIVTS